MPINVTSPANDNWIPACGGTEKEFKTHSGRRLLYCWNPAQNKHAYYDVGADIILSNDEAWEALHG